MFEKPVIRFGEILNIVQQDKSIIFYWMVINVVLGFFFQMKQLIIVSVKLAEMPNQLSKRKKGFHLQ